MATSIEARVPFLDNEIIDFARSLPRDFKQTLHHRKRVLKDVALRYLPAEIVHRRKSGFGVPLPLWFRGNGPLSRLLDDVVSAAETLAPFEKSSMTRIAEAHRSGRGDYSELLWGLLNIGLWRTTFRC